MEDEIKSNSKPQKSRTRWHWLRIAVQIIFFLLFIFLLLDTLQNAIPAFHDLFFNLDPLNGIAAMLASRSWILGMALGIFTLVITLLIGRAWCGWLCPMGTILDWTPSRRSTKDMKDIPAFWRQVKYLSLFIILFTALFGSLTLIFLDPITLLFRTLAGVILPGLNFFINSAESWLYNFNFLAPAVNWLDSSLRPWLLTDQPFYLSNLAMLAFFAAILALNAIRTRFWCRYLCPLGGLLALVSKISQYGLKVDEGKCKSCQRCSTICPTMAIDPQNKYEVNIEECTLCLNCVDSCRLGAYKFSRQPLRNTASSFDPSRRQLFYAIGGGILGGLMLRFIPVFTGTIPSFLRPPGTTETSLQNKCIRCGECIKVCPTGVIKPSSSLANWDKLWTPVLEMRQGYCSYSCNSCGEVCPTGAIPELTLAEKRHVVIGRAIIDEKRCIPYAEGRDCGVCEEMCPIPSKAIQLNEQYVTNLEQKRVRVKLPIVRGMCTGCGICETKCPVDGVSAIRVFSLDSVEVNNSRNSGLGLIQGR